MRTYSEKAQCIRGLFLLLAMLGTFFTKAQEKDGMSWRKAQRQEAVWYGSEEAQQVADNVLLYQNNNGGWVKNIDMAKPLEKTEIQKLQKAKSIKVGTSIDNGATFTQLRFLAKVYQATDNKAYKEAFIKGMDFLLEAQYENGGWPQFYPIREGYYEHITFNDDAMMGVMELLRDIAHQKEPYAFVDAPRRAKAMKAIDKGLEVILRTQIPVDGKLSIWCAQHDKDDFSPAKARTYELPSLSGKESIRIVEYLMGLEHPGPEVKEAVRSAVKWYKENSLSGRKVIWVKNDSLPEGVDRLVVKDPEAGPLWARFYEIGTNKPIFVGRDGIIKSQLSEIEHERRINYSYLGDYATQLLETEYPEWEKRF